MDREDVLRRVRELDPEVTERALRHAADRLLREATTATQAADERWPRKVALLARELDLFVALGLTPYSRVTRAELLERLEGPIAAVRRHYFPQTSTAPRSTPPFDSDTKAADWIDSMRTELYPSTIEESLEYEQLRDALDDAVTAIEESTGWRTDYDGLKPWYVLREDLRERGKLVLWEIISRSRLFALARAAHFIAHCAGFPEEDVVRLILTGAEPRLPRAQIQVRTHARKLPDLEPVYRWPSDDPDVIGRTEVSVTFRTPDLTLDDLKEVFAMIKAQWAAKPTKDRVTDADLLLHEIMRDMGQLRSTGKRPHGFWDAVHAEWIARGGDDTTATALKVRWDALHRKLRRIERGNDG
jgi:hypothetical protein